MSKAAQRTGVFGEAYLLYAAAGNLRRTLFGGKMAIYERTLIDVT